MKRNYKLLPSLAGSLAVSLNTLFLGLPAASEEVQVLPPQELPSCLEKLPILEADKTSEGAGAIPVAVPSTGSTEEVPHTRYLPTPPNLSSTTANSGVSDNKPTTLEPESPVSQPSNLQTTIGCAQTVKGDPVVDSPQTGVLPETAKTENPAPSPSNDEIEKSMENSERSLNGLRPF
jgi:hypothetical protein